MGHGALSLPSDLEDAWGQIQQAAAVHDGATCRIANDPFATLLGYGRPEEVAGRPMGDFFSPWPAGPPRLGTRACLGRHRDGTGLDVETTCLPFLAEGGVLYQTLVRDVTERKSWEDRLVQSERLTAMGKLAGEIAHEINNPLGGILLYGNLLREDLPTESPALANLEKIIKLATRCRIIAKGLLNFGRSSSQSHVPVDLNQTVREMFSLVEDHQLLRGVEVTRRLAPGLPHLMADKGQMEQVVLNLVINAGEAMNGHGRLLLETASASDPPTVRLVIEDSGPGISEDLLPRIFEPFFTTKRPGRGTGLGLSITHGIVQRHGGRIVVKGGPGKGARFEVIFPLRQVMGY